jgi:hypothetical protein
VRPHRHSACRLAPVRWTDWLASQWAGSSRKKRRRRKNRAGAASVIVVVGSWWKADAVDLAPDVPMTGRFHLS